MSRWIDLPDVDRQQTAYIIAEEKGISEGAVEKDWWVTTILKVLFTLSPSKYMFFKGGTSLSKGWQLIDRFSEDIDIALYREFYLEVRGKDCAKCENNNQVKKLRIVNRDYVVGELAEELKSRLADESLECEVEPITHHENGTPIDHDSDPVVIEVRYKPYVKSDAYVRPVVKIEISCLSMREPYELRNIESFVHERYPKVDDESVATIPTITPTRTFLEKAFLLNEEYQRSKPRTNRMSRHLYDLERLMDTTFSREALADSTLYNRIIEHRRRFYHVGGVNYEMNSSENIAFCPIGDTRKRLQSDYDTMKESMLYGDKLSFEELMQRLDELQKRFRKM